MPKESDKTLKIQFSTIGLHLTRCKQEKYRYKKTGDGL